MDLKPIKRSLKDKRGMGIGDIYPTILVIALISILLGVVLFVLNEFTDQIASTGQLNSVINESGAWLNTTPYQVNAFGNCSFQDFAVVGMWNESGGGAIPAANYTVVAATGSFTNATTNVVHPSIDEVNLSYVYRGGGTACEATEDIVEEIADFVPWIGIILLVIAAAIVLGLLVKNLAGGQRV